MDALSPSVCPVITYWFMPLDCGQDGGVRGCRYRWHWMGYVILNSWLVADQAIPGKGGCASDAGRARADPGIMIPFNQGPIQQTDKRSP